MRRSGMIRSHTSRGSVARMRFSLAVRMLGLAIGVLLIRIRPASHGSDQSLAKIGPGYGAVSTLPYRPRFRWGGPCRGQRHSGPRMLRLAEPSAMAGGM